MIWNLTLVALAIQAQAQTPPAVSGNIAAVGHHCVIRVLQTDPLPTTGMVPIVVKGARGEFVDFQVFIAGAGGAGLSGVNVSLSNFTGPAGVTLSNSNANIYFEYYIPVTKATTGPPFGPFNYSRGTGMYPDALIPLGPDPYYGEIRSPMGQGTAFSVAAGQNQGIWVDLFIPPGTLPGAYAGIFTIASGGNTLNLPIQLTIWNIAIPATASIPAIFGGGGVSAGFAPLNGSATATLQEIFLKDAVRNRISLAGAVRGSVQARDWYWNGSSIIWKDSNPYTVYTLGFDATEGAFLNGTYSGPGANDPFLKTGPKLSGFYAFSLDSGYRQAFNNALTDDLKTRLDTPRPVTVSTTSTTGSLPAGTWYYMVTSSVTGQGDSGPLYPWGTNEVSATLGGPGSVTLSWPVPKAPNGRTPDAFAIYRSPNPSMGAVGSGHGETLFAVIAAPGTPAAGFTDDGSLPGNLSAPHWHYYNATAGSEAVSLIAAFGQHFSQNGWPTPLAYMFDEPGSSSNPDQRNAFESIAYWSDIFRQAGLVVRTLATTDLPDPWGSNALPQYRRNLVGKLDTWVPSADHTTQYYWPAAYKNEQSLGRHVWFYDADVAAIAPGLQPGNILDYPALTQRIRFWWAAHENYEGYLYYASLGGNAGEWSYSPDIWTNGIYSFGNNGDGLIFYPGRPCPGPGGSYCIGGTHPIPVDSMRLKMTRDSEQDLEYLLKFQQANGQNAENQILATVFATATLSQPLTSSAQTIPLSTVAGMHNPFNAWPDSFVNIYQPPPSFGEMAAYDGVNSSNNSLTPCKFNSPCRGLLKSPAMSYPAGTPVLVPPNNVLGSYFGDPSPLLQARGQLACALDPGSCPTATDTVPPAPFRGLMIK